MIINVNDILRGAKKRKKEPDPLPVVIVGKVRLKPPTPEPHAQPEPAQPDLLQQLEIEYSRHQKQRQVLSSKNWRLVQQVEQEFKKQGTALATEFMLGNVPSDLLARHYQAIEAHTKEMAVLWDKMEHVKRYGQLPDANDLPKPLLRSITSDSNSSGELQNEIRRLDDLIYKTRRKLHNAKSGIRGPKNSNRVNDWNLKIALAEARRDELKVKLKRLRA